MEAQQEASTPAVAEGCPAGFVDTPYQYQKGLTPLVLAGVVRPARTQIICKAILARDAYGRFEFVDYKPSEAECHEIVAMGWGVLKALKDQGCPDEDLPEVGMHAYIRSTAADRMDTALSGRYWLIDVADLKALWIPATFRTKIEEPKTAV